jgi:uncharacterized protein YceK
MKTRPLAALVLLAVLLSGCGTLLALPTPTPTLPPVSYTQLTLPTN